MKEIYHLDANIIQVRPDIFSGVLWIVKGDLSVQKLMSLKIPEDKLTAWENDVDLPAGLMLKEVISGVLIFSELKDPANSESNRILCIDSFTGEKIYDEKGWYFDCVKDRANFILKRPFQDSIKHKVLELEDVPVLKSFSLELSHPSVINVSKTIYKDILGLLDNVSNNVSGAIEILETKYLVITSFHIRTEQKMSKLLVIFNENGQTIKKFEIATQLDKFIDESFFVWGNFVIFVQEKMKLHILNLENILT